MAIVQIQPRLVHPLGRFPSIAGSTTLTMDAAGESVGLIGDIVWKGGISGDSKVCSGAGGGAIYVPFAATQVFSDVGSRLDFGLQDLTAGVDDGVFDVSGTWIGGTDTVDASDYNRIPMESGSKTVSYGQKVAQVVEMVTRAGTDAVQVEGQSIGPALLSGIGYASPYGTQDTGAGPVKRVAPCPFIIEFDDGTLGYCVGYPAALGLRGITAVAVSNASTPDEYANIFTPMVPTRVGALWAYCTNVAAADGIALHLYEDPYGTPNEIAAITLDVANQASTGGIFTGWFTGGESVNTDLAVGSPYALSIRPWTANTISLFIQDVGAGNELLKEFSDLEGVQLATRSNQTGAFTDGSTTEILVAGLWAIGLDNGVGGGAGYGGGRGTIVAGGGVGIYG